MEQYVGRPPEPDLKKLADVADIWWWLGEMRPLLFPLDAPLPDQDDSRLRPRVIDKRRLQPGAVWRDEIAGLAEEATPQMVTLPRGKYRMGSLANRGCRRNAPSTRSTSTMCWRSGVNP